MTSLLPLLRDHAPGRSELGGAATSEQLEGARAEVAKVLQLHTDLTVENISMSDFLNVDAQEHALAQLQGFLVAVDWAIDRLDQIPPDGSTARRGAWEFVDALEELRTPARRPINLPSARDYRRRLIALASAGASVAQSRLMDIEEQATTAASGSLTLEPGSVDAVRLGLFIKAARKEARMQPEAFTVALGKSAGYIRMLERGEKVASAETYEAIFGLLGFRVARQGPTLTVRDEAGLQVEINLVPATPKSALVQRARVAEQEVRPMRAERATLARIRASVALDSGDSDRASSTMLLGEVTRLLAHAEPATLRMVLRLLQSGESSDGEEDPGQDLGDQRRTDVPGVAVRNPPINRSPRKPR